MMKGIPLAMFNKERLYTPRIQSAEFFYFSPLHVRRNVL